MRAQLDGDRDALRAALAGPDQVRFLLGGAELRAMLCGVPLTRYDTQTKALVQKKEEPKELARGGDSLAQSMDEVLDLFGAA